MQCPSCGAGIPDDSRRCEFCQRPVDQPATLRAVVPRPEKYHVEDDADGLRIWWRWFSPAVFFLIPFAIAWNAFLFGWYGMAVSDFGESMPGAMRLIFLIFPLGHVAVGVGMIYAVLTMLLNRSEVRIDRGVLTISHGPIYWPGTTLDSDEIEQIFCSSTVRKGENGEQTTFALRAKLKNGSAKTLLSHVQASEEALYLEQAIERALRIADTTVQGELPRV